MMPVTRRSTIRAVRRFCSSSHSPYVSKHICQRTGVHIINLEHASGTQSWGTPLAEHRFFPTFMQELEQQLDESTEAIKAGLPQGSCIVLHNAGKYWSNGYDLKWMAANPDQVAACLQQSERLLAKMITSQVPIVAALSGHATALGMMMALACDFRVMGERGLFSTPAVDLNLSLSPGLVGIVKAKLPPHLQRDVLLYGKKFRSDELLRENVISVRPDTRDEHELLQACLSFVESHVLPMKALTKPDKLEATKKTLYADVYRALSSSSGSDHAQYSSLAATLK